MSTTVLLSSVVAVADPAGPAPKLHWRELLKRTHYFTGTNSYDGYLSGLPAEEWLDPELHEWLLDHLTRWYASNLGLDYLSPKIEWAILQKPELAKIWLPENNSKLLNKVLTTFWTSAHNPFEFLPQYPKISRGAVPPQNRKKNFLDSLQGKTLWSPFRSSLEVDWNELYTLYEADPEFQKQVALVLAKSPKSLGLTKEAEKTRKQIANKWELVQKQFHKSTLPRSPALPTVSEIQGDDRTRHEPESKVKPKSADGENTGRLGLEDGSMRFRGALAKMMDAPSLLKDPRFRQGVSQGLAAQSKAFDDGIRELKNNGLDLNPYTWLHKSLEDFIKNTALPPKPKPLPPHELERRLRETMESWPENPTDLEYTAIRQDFENRVRRRLNYEEVESKRTKNQVAASKQKENKLFEIWKRHALRALEERFKHDLLFMQGELGAHGVALTHPQITSKNLESYHFNSAGHLVDPDGASLHVDPRAMDLLEQEILTGPEQVASKEVLNRRLALARAGIEFIKTTELSAASLQGRSGSATKLLGHLAEARAARRPQIAASSNEAVKAFLWSRISKEGPNVWRNLQLEAVANNLAARPFWTKDLRHLLKALGIVGAATSAVLGGEFALIKHISAPTAGLSSSLIKEPSLENPGPPPENGSGSSGKGHDGLLKLRYGGEDNPTFYSMGYEREFVNGPRQAITLHTDWDYRTAFVEISTDGLQPVPKSGYLPIVRPDGGQIHWALVRNSFYDEMRQGIDYEVVVDPRTRDMAIHIFKPEDKSNRSVTIDLSYDKAPPGSLETQEEMNLGSQRAFDPILEGSKLKRIVAELKEAGFESLPRTVEIKLKTHGGKIHSSELADIASSSERYSYRKTNAPKLATEFQWRQNPFLPYSVALNEAGEFAAVCGAQNLLQAEIINQYFGDDQYHAEVRASYANIDHDDQLRAGEAHARTYLFKKGEKLPIVLDATPVQTDWTPDHKRTDRLPSHGRTPEEQRHEWMVDAENSYVWKRRPQEELDEFFSDLEGKVKAERERAETAEEYILREWLQRTAPVHDQGGPAAAALLSPKPAAENSAPAYAIMASVREDKRRLMALGKELRRLRAAGKLHPSDPVVTVTRLNSRMLSLLSEAPSQQDWQVLATALRTELEEAQADFKDLKILAQVLADYHRAQGRGRTPKLTPEQQEVVQRLHFNPKNPRFSLPDSMTNSMMTDLIESQYDRMIAGLDNLNSEGVETIEALHQMRLYQPELHQSRVSAAMNNTPPHCMESVLKQMK